MDNDLEVRHVPFMGTELMAARDNSGEIWAGVSYICKGIGLNKNEKDRQVKNIQSDSVLIKGCVKFDAGVFDPNNPTIALKLDYVPLWLAKISITPKMEQNNPELADRLVQYQLKAKDVLANAFINGINRWGFELPSDYASALRALADSVEQNIELVDENAALFDENQQQKEQIKEMLPAKIYSDAIAVSNDSCFVSDVAKMLCQNGINVGPNRLFSWLREKGYLSKRNGRSRNVPTQRSIERGLFEIGQSVVNDGDKMVVQRAPLVTGKGQKYLVNHFLFDEAMDGQIDIDLDSLEGKNE